ncbi:MAG: NAD(P)/FAD-dependent oxidoreductase [Mariprofundus sp.]|nr:NAD(P)/FAD-dependent oxidoreductase [Mariprofundus sp.]
MNNTYDIIIIGAGAAGLMCAATAAELGKSVLLLDHAEKAGKKILISGGGRCNFTNRFTKADNFISNNPHFCKSALARFSAHDFIAMVEAAGIAYHERKHGQLFCDDSAKNILEMLMAPCREHGVSIQLNTKVKSISEDYQPKNLHPKQQHQFTIETERDSFSCTSLVIATGGLSIPKMGATPFGVTLAERFGLNIIQPVAGLVPFTFTGQEKESLQSLAGMSLDVSVQCRGHVFNEAMLFTHRGLSGPAMLQISSYWQPGDTLSINLLPKLASHALLNLKKQRPNAQLSTVLCELLAKRLVHLLMPGEPGQTKMRQINDKQLQHITALLQNWQLKPNGTEGYRTAEVTLGGVDTNELSSKTMQSKKVPGLYFIGEVVDVSGHLGGFNFQWAWSSGYAAAMAIYES